MVERGEKNQRPTGVMRRDSLAIEVAHVPLAQLNNLQMGWFLGPAKDVGVVIILPYGYS